MRLMKKIAAVTMAMAMTVSLTQAAAPIKVDAQVAYKTNKVYISTDLVPNDPGKISTTKDGSTPIISTTTNVQFDLDCNVDCTWKVKPEEEDKADKDTGVAIDTMGHVTIEKEAQAGTYHVTAEGKNINNSLDKTALCKIKVNNTIDPASATSITLDKKAIEEQVPEGVIQVNENGKGMKVNGKVEDVKLYTNVEPSYLLESDVNFSSKNTNAGKITTAEDGTETLFTSQAESENFSLMATAGRDKQTTTFFVKINSKDYTATINCDNIPASDVKDSNYNVRLNEDLDFCIEDNLKNTLPQVDVKNVKWTLFYGKSSNSAKTDKIADCNGEEKIETPLGIFTFSDQGKKVNLKTPVKNKDSEDYKKYIEALKEKNIITLKAVVPKEVQGASAASDFAVGQISLSFIDEVNAISSIKLDFEKAGLVKDKDFSMKKEILNNTEEDVYYFESDDEGNNKIDLAAATFADIPGIRDFAQAKEANFYGNDVKYGVTYKLSDLGPETFGSSDTTEKYINNELGSGETSQMGEVNTKDCTLTKKGIGYKVLTVNARGTNKIYPEQKYILRFVSNADSMEICHESYNDNEPEYNNNAVVHVRQGEADKPVVYVSGAQESKGVTVYDPYLEYTYTVIKGDGTLATATTDAATETLMINALAEGKLIVNATSVVDKSETASYVLYINDEILSPDSIQIDTVKAVNLKMMTANGDVNGHYENIPLELISNGDNAGIPIVEWTSSDPEYATVTQDGKVTTLKSTGQKTVTITAKCRGDENLKASIDLHIIDVPATGIKTIAEKVEEGKEACVAPDKEKENTGTCKAYTTFSMCVKDYVPENLTKADGKITWTSSKPEVAEIDENGKVTTFKEGITTITAVYTSGSSASSPRTYTLTVSGFADVVESIECQEKVKLTRVGTTYTLQPEVKPENAVNKAVKYETKDKNIATVTDSGVVTAVAPGTTTIVISSVAKPAVKKEVEIVVQGLPDVTPNPGETAKPTASPTQTPVTIPTQAPVATPVPVNTVPVTVAPAEPVKKSVKKPVITLSKKTIKRKKTATVKIANKAKNAKVTFKLDKKSKKVVKVSKKGKITGKKKGTAQIMVTVVQNGKTYKKKLKIKVK